MALSLVPPRQPFDSARGNRLRDLLQHGTPDTYAHRQTMLRATVNEGEYRGLDVDDTLHLLKAACLLKENHRTAERDRAWYRDFDRSRVAARKALRNACRAAGMHPEVAEHAIARHPILNPEWFVRDGDLNPEINWTRGTVTLHRSNGARRLPRRGNPLNKLVSAVRHKLAANGWTDTERRSLLFAVGLAALPKDER